MHGQQSEKAPRPTSNSLSPLTRDLDWIEDPQDSRPQSSDVSHAGAAASLAKVRETLATLRDQKLELDEKIRKFEDVVHALESLL